MTFWVRQAVLQDPRIGTSDITVDTSDGIVTLVGGVPNVSARQYADREAKKITGVRGVVNELFVTPSFCVDADITQDVRKRLITSASISSDTLRVTVHQGIVTLEGTVASGAERQEAGLLAGEVRGVKDVTNKLVVQYPNTRPDAEIQRDVATTLAHDVYLTGLPIAATVKNGAVTLVGEVATVYQQERAGDAARLVWNVTGVNNDLTVTQGGSMGTRQKSPTPTDAQLTAAVYDTLAADQRLAPSEVTVYVQQGEVTLHGVVPRMVKTLEPSLTGEVTIQPSRAPRLDFNCVMPHIHCPCARKRWRETDAWIGRPYWHTSQGRSIKSCWRVMSIWSRKIVSSATRSRGASG